MNIDINALQALPELDAAPTGLRPAQCGPRRTKIICVKPTCKITVVVVGVHE